MLTKSTRGEYEDESSFISNIKVQRDEGYSFVPLTGAGLSAPSGVPIIKEIHQYLIKCIALALGVNRPYDYPRGIRQYQHEWRWHPQRDDWPPIRCAHSYRGDTDSWKGRIYSTSHEMLSRVEADPDNRRLYPEFSIFHEAYGATADWATSLLFLARLREDTETGQLKLGPVDPIVIDNFFLNVVLGKKPAIGHRMLARLSGPLRINTILTLNFEDLIEKAFEEVGNILTVYAVHYESGLPAYHNRFTHNALIKVHGDRYGLRADYSVSAEPSEDDCRHFTSYLVGKPIDRETFRKLNQDSDKLSSRSHLLVTGLSGKEDRVMNMIRRANEVIDGLKVFWIGFTNDDCDFAARRLEGYCGLNKPDQIHVTQSHFHGLLFFNMYQQLYGALPPDGAIFPSQSRVPVPPLVMPVRKCDEGDNQGQQFAKVINDAIEDRLLLPEDSDQYRLVLADRDDAADGGSISYHNQLDWGRQAIWIDMDEIVDTDDLFESMLAAIARKAGISDWIPVLAQSQDTSRGSDEGSSEDEQQERKKRDQEEHEERMMLRQQELARLTNNPDRKWIIYLNTATSPAGSNFWPAADHVHWHASPKYGNGWVDYDRNDTNSLLRQSKNDNLDSFFELISGTCQRQCPNITIVLICKKNTCLTNKLINMDHNKQRGQSALWAVGTCKQKEIEIDIIDEWLNAESIDVIREVAYRREKSIQCSSGQLVSFKVYEVIYEYLKLNEQETIGDVSADLLHIDPTKPKPYEKKGKCTREFRDGTGDKSWPPARQVVVSLLFDLVWRYRRVKGLSLKANAISRSQIKRRDWKTFVTERVAKRLIQDEIYRRVERWRQGYSDEDLTEGEGGKPNADLAKARDAFLRAFVAVNRVRPPALLWTTSFHTGGKVEADYDHDNDIAGNREGLSMISARGRMEQTKQYLEELEGIGAIGFQDGGFVWMGGELRRMLRSYYTSKHKEDPLALIRSIKVHEELAKWYARLHVCSISERAATESVYHRAIQAKLIFEKMIAADFSKGQPAQHEHDLRWVLQSIGASLRILRQSTPSILASGYTQGTQRRLEELYKRFEKIESIQCKELLNKLRENINEEDYNIQVKRLEQAFWRLYKIMITLGMDVAREIGDHTKAERKWCELYSKEVSPINMNEHSFDPRRSFLDHAYSDQFRGVWQEIRMRNRRATLGIARRNDLPGRELACIRKHLGYLDQDLNGFSPAREKIGTEKFSEKVLREKIYRWLNERSDDIARSLPRSME